MHEYQQLVKSSHSSQLVSLVIIHVMDQIEVHRAFVEPSIVYSVVCSCLSLVFSTIHINFLHTFANLLCCKKCRFSRPY